MDDNLPTRTPSGSSEIARSGFVSGSMPGPQFNPEVLVFAVVRVLAQAGVRVEAEPNPYTATNAAADLLRALGVRPTNAPLGQ